VIKKIKQLINIGTNGLPEKEARRTRVVNMMCICTVSFPFLYSLLYLYIGTYIPMTLNWFVIILYGLTFYMNHKRKRELAKIWLLSIYTLHLFVLTKIIFSAATGVHYYYMVLPPISFLIFNYNQVLEKILACVFPIAMFVLCDSLDFFSPLVSLSAETSKMIHLSSILFMFIGLIFIIYLFSNDIKENEDTLEESIRNLEQAMSEIKTLKGLIPICSTCKKIRDDKGFWNNLEAHIQKHSHATFSHGICPDCADEMYGKEDWYNEVKTKISKADKHQD